MHTAAAYILMLLRLLSPVVCYTDTATMFLVMLVILVVLVMLMIVGDVGNAGDAGDAATQSGCSHGRSVIHLVHSEDSHTD